MHSSSPLSEVMFTISRSVRIQNFFRIDVISMGSLHSIHSVRDISETRKLGAIM